MYETTKASEGVCRGSSGIVVGPVVFFCSREGFVRLLWSYWGGKFFCTLWIFGGKSMLWVWEAGLSVVCCCLVLPLWDGS